jgi:glutathione peroxidase
LYCAKSNFAKEELKMALYDLTVKDAKGNDVSLSDYKGKVLLIVNTAIRCGFTPQYSELQDLYDKYKDKGFEILDFPCNQFANQAPGTDEEIGSFCTGRYGITFRQFSKIDVNGENESPLYSWLKSQKRGFGGSNIKWNFTKFLINKKGEVVARYASTKTPKAIEKDVAELVEG